MSDLLGNHIVGFLIMRLICCQFQLFITVMDKLRLEIRAMDEIQPDLKELMDAMSRLMLLPADFEGKEKVKTW